MTEDNHSSPSMKNWKPLVSFAAVSMILLAGFKADLLYHMEQYSLFGSGKEFLASFFEQPGGFLALLGAFLTQFCHFPLIGAFLLTALLCLLALVVAKAFGLEGKKEWLAYIPSLFLVLFVTRLDYSIYLQKAYGLVYSQALGFLAATALLLLYRKCLEGKKAAWIYVAAVIILGYPLIGSYALVAAVLIVLECLRSKKHFIPALACALVLGAAVPLLCSKLHWLFPRINQRYAFWAGFPCMDFVKVFICQVPLILAFAALVALVFSESFGRRLPLPAFIICALALIGLTNWDGNFDAMLKMERASSARDWDKILKLAAKKQEPTRPLVLYRDIALYNKGELTEKMFTYPDGGTPLKSPANIPVSMVCSVPVQYWCGMVNSCERSCMEFSTSYSKNIFYFKYQAMSALIKGDRELAAKYIDVVEGNWFQGAWVRRYRAFLENQSEMASDKEFQMLLPLLDFQGVEADLASSLEAGMVRHYEYLEYVNEYAYEWQIAMALMQKNEPYFLKLFFDRYENHQLTSVTKGAAEAAALFGGISDDGELLSMVAEALSSRQSILKNFGTFANSMNMATNIDNPDTVKRFRSRYGDTYWFYYFFVNDIPSN